MPSLTRARRLVPLLFAALGGACSGGGNGGGENPQFVVRSTSGAVAGDTRIALSGALFAYLADEGSTGGGTDLNGDGDELDAVVRVVDVNARAETDLAVAAEAIAWVGADLYLAVDEAQDGRDWNASPDDDLVLVHWAPGEAEPQFVATLDAADGLPLVATPAGLFFPLAVEGALAGHETNLAMLVAGEPLTPIPVPASWGGAGLRARILGQDEGLVFLLLDEADAGESLNTLRVGPDGYFDSDAEDTRVLALVDGTIGSPVVHNTEVALGGATLPFRARARGGSDWLVAFLASEAAHVTEAPGAAFTGFNDRSLFAPSWRPTQCLNPSMGPEWEDLDTDDDVLFWVRFADWVMNPDGSPPVNTGLTGTDRVVALDEHVGTISREADEGPYLPSDVRCDLNADGDTDDRIVRWVHASVPVLPPTAAPGLIALAQPAAIPGGTLGLAELEGRLVIQASEQADGKDYDGDGEDSDLLAWFDPDASTEWRFDHGATDAQGVFRSFFSGATWLAETPDRALLLAGIPESGSAKNRDDDEDDSLPTFLRWDPARSRLAFPFVPFALDSDNAGIAVANGFAFVRVSEAEDAFDYDADGDVKDFALLRVSLASGTVSYMGTADGGPRPVVVFDAGDASPFAGAFLAAEAGAFDFNGDGDSSDLVVRYFQM